MDLDGFDLNADTSGAFTPVPIVGEVSLEQAAHGFDSLPLILREAAVRRTLRLHTERLRCHWRHQADSACRIGKRL